jgi:hypothetical protein
MKAQLTRYTINNMLEETGHDYILIHVFFKTDSRSETTNPIIFSYDDWHRYIKTIDEAAYDYLTKIRSGIHGYGPKHSAVFKVIEAENFDLEPYIKTYVEGLTDLFIEQHYEWCDRLSNPETVEKAAVAFEKINQLVDEDYKNQNIKTDQFIDEVDQTLHELTFKYFPDLFEKGEKYIEEYRSILSRTTLSFYEAIDKLMFKSES